MITVIVHASYAPQANGTAMLSIISMISILDEVNRNSVNSCRGAKDERLKKSTTKKWQRANQANFGSSLDGANGTYVNSTGKTLHWGAPIFWELTLHGALRVTGKALQFVTKTGKTLQFVTKGSRRCYRATQSDPGALQIFVCDDFGEVRHAAKSRER